MRADLARIVAFGVVATALTGLLYATLTNVVDGETRTYVAEFTDVAGLHEGDDVRVAGVRVGRVEEMALDGARADVTLTVQAAQPVFENTRAVIRYQNLIGQRFVALVPGAGAARPMADGDRIPVARTQPSFDLTALFNGFEPILSTLEPAEVNRLSATITAVAQGSGAEIGPLLDETAQLTNTIADRDEVIGKVLVDLSAVLDQVAGKDAELDALLGETRRLVDGLNERSDRSFDALADIRRFSVTAGDLISDIRPDVEADLMKATRVAGLFAREEEAVDATLKGLPGFLGVIARIGQYGSWVNLYTCSLAINVPGVPEPVESPGERQTEVCR